MRLPWQHHRPAYRTIPLEEAQKHVLCAYCGGVHSYLCPRIKHVAYDLSALGVDGTPRVAAVEFWPEYGAQLWADVIWPEEAS